MRKAFPFSEFQARINLSKSERVNLFYYADEYLLKINLHMSIWTCGPEDGNRLGRSRNCEDTGRVPIPDNLTIVQIAIGWKHGHFFTDQNDFYSWGTGTSWRLGNGSRSNLPTPTKINTFPPDTKFKQIACGDKFSAATTQNGGLIVWGAGYAHTPSFLELPSPAEFIACGQISLLAALSDGSVMQFYRHLPSVHHHFDDEKIISVACGANHKLALAESGKVYSWGTSPATGQGSVELPRVIRSLLETPMCGIFAYHNSSFFLDTQYRVWCCGSNSSGSLGLGHIDDVSIPILQDFNFKNEQIVQIACGDDFTLYLTVNGNVWASGNGGDHRNATGSNETRTRPALASKLSGHFISQVAAGCFNAAFLENGCPPFNHMMQFRGNFSDFLVPQLPFRTTMLDRLNVEIDPNSELLKKYGFMTNDIIIFKGTEKAKVIGVTNEQIAVIREEKNQICVLEGEDIMFDFIAKHPLVSRVNAELHTFKCNLGFDLSVDANPNETLPLGGFLYNDIVKSNGKEYTVIGARVGKIWALSKNDGLIYQHDPSDLIIVKRENQNVKQFDTINNEKFVVEISNDFENLVFSEKYGIGFFTGMIGKKFCYSFICQPDKIQILEKKLEFARTKSSEKTITGITIEYDQVQFKTSCEATEPLGVYCFDRIKYKARINDEEVYQYGIVIGVYNDQVCVKSDRMSVSSCYCELIDPATITIIGRVNIQSSVKYGDNSYSINSSDFIKTNYLPGDRIEIDKKKGMIIGIRDDKVYALMDGESEPIPVPDNAVRIACYIDSDAWQDYGDGVIVNISLMHCALLLIKPGDQAETFDNCKVQYLGRDSSNNLWFRNETTNEKEKLTLGNLNPDSFIIDLC